LCNVWPREVLASGLTNSSSSGCGQSHDLFKFWEMIDNILDMVQDRDIVTMEDW